MANSVKTSVVVRFSSEDDDNAIFSAEVDSRDEADGGLNEGKTSFEPGDTVKILLHRTSNTTVDFYDSSLGSLVKGSSTNYVHTDTVTFASETKATVNKPIVGSITNVKWVGNSLGSLKPLPYGTGVELSVKPAEKNYVAVAKITYTTSATVYTLSNTGFTDSEYDISVLFVGTQTTS